MARQHIMAKLAVSIFFFCLPAIVDADAGKIHPRDISISKARRQDTSSNTDGKCSCDNKEKRIHDSDISPYRRSVMA